MKIDPEANCVRCKHFGVCKHVEHTMELIRRLPRTAAFRQEARERAQRDKEPPDDPTAPVLYTAVANVCAAYLPGEHEPGKSLWPDDLEEMTRKAKERP